MKVWYGGPGQLENLRDVEAGLLREDSGEKEEDDKEEVKTMVVMAFFMVELAFLMVELVKMVMVMIWNEQVEADRMALLSIERNIANMERRWLNHLLGAILSARIIRIAHLASIVFLYFV